jgi:hypothetical protein
MKKIILAFAVAAVATMAVAVSASAGVDRYQTQSMTITAVQPEGAISQWGNVWTHTFNNVTLNPCDGSFEGTGSLSGTINGFYSNETITGQLNGDGTISFTVNRPDGVETFLSNAQLGGTAVTLATSNPTVSWPLEFKVSATTTATSTFKNHGDYVSQAGDKAEAAHSCIGMPIQ